jgi:hypothetical protein
MGHCDHFLQILDLPNTRDERTWICLLPIPVDCQCREHDPSNLLVDLLFWTVE